MSDNLSDIQKFRFYDIFQRNEDGSLTPRRTLRIGGVTFGPGVSFSRGVSFSGIDIFQYQGLDIAGIDLEGEGILEIRGFYNP